VGQRIVTDTHGGNDNISTFKHSAPNLYLKCEK